VPNRILKESVCTSDTLDVLSAEAERLFYRLLVQCDDFGRFDARPAIVRARCLPLKVDAITDADVSGWILELERAGLITTYSVGGHCYLQMVTWERHQQKRAKHSKYPAPEEHDGTCNQLLADAGNSPRETRNEKRETRTGSRRTAKAAAGGPTETTKEKPSGPSIAPLFDAFRARSLPDPALIGVESKRAQALLGVYSADQVADCWLDYSTGRYGTPLDRSNLSFDYLARNNRIGNWLTRQTDQATTNGYMRNGKPAVAAISEWDSYAVTPQGDAA
jgi:hypothetical protein